MNRKALATVLIALPMAAQDFAGPSVLSRGASVQQQRDHAIVHFSPYVSVGVTYGSNLTAFSLSPTGDFAKRTSVGETASVGLSLFHNWRSSALAFTYTASATHYEHAAPLDNVTQGLNLSFSHELTRRSSFSLSQSLGISSRIAVAPQIDLAFNGFGSQPVGFFDSRALSFNTIAGISYSLTPRWSVSVNGGMSTAKYQSSGLTGYLGYMASGDLNYRVTRRTTLGAAYQFSTFSYKNQYGDAYTHTVSGLFSRQLSRRWAFSSSAGIYRTDVNSLQTIEVDPIIAAILGSSLRAVLVSNKTHMGFAGSATISGTYPHHHLYVGYTRGMTPGNGLYVTAEQESAVAGYSYSLGGWAINSTLSWSHLKALQQNFAPASVYHADIGTGHRIFKPLYFSVNAGYASINSFFGSINRSSWETSASLTFAPGDIPLRF